MLRIAIVEDNPKEQKQLQDQLQAYAHSRGETFEFSLFPEAAAFLEPYRAEYDMVFMDIELPGMDGMRAAHRLRELDQQVVLIFVTNMAQFAVNGYEVDALDYIVKPVRYGPLCAKLDRAVTRCKAALEAVTIPQPGGSKRLLLREILYIEVNGHKLTYHTERGVFEGSGTLQEMEDHLQSKGFLRCNKCYLVNQCQVRGLQGSDLFLANGETLQISRLRRKALLEKMAENIGNDVVL